MEKELEARCPNCWLRALSFPAQHLCKPQTPTETLSIPGFLLAVCLHQKRKKNLECKNMGGACKHQKTHGCSILPAECKSRHKHCCRV
uniref:Uncharacterized protein n=1 Tax=Rhinolophus ferrumequinum TaxID=59479 RepID=A0A671F7G7_RHIFE